jgi:hypothetical protein
MLSIGVWRWYINIAITVLDIIHRPVFYLKLNSTLYVCPHLTGITLHLRYEPNRLMLYIYIYMWRWHINIIITILDIIHRHVFYLKLTGNILRLRYEPNRLMLSIGLWRWYIHVIITFLDIIQRPVFYLKYIVSETGFCLHLQVDGWCPELWWSY